MINYCDINLSIRKLYDEHAFLAQKFTLNMFSESSVLKELEYLYFLKKNKSLKIFMYATENCLR